MVRFWRSDVDSIWNSSVQMHLTAFQFYLARRNSLFISFLLVIFVHYRFHYDSRVEQHQRPSATFILDGCIFCNEKKGACQQGADYWGNIGRLLPSILSNNFSTTPFFIFLSDFLPSPLILKARTLLFRHWKKKSNFRSNKRTNFTENR